MVRKRTLLEGSKKNTMILLVEKMGFLLWIVSIKRWDSPHEGTTAITERTSPHNPLGSNMHHLDFLVGEGNLPLDKESGTLHGRRFGRV